MRNGGALYSTVRKIKNFKNIIFTCHLMQHGEKNSDSKRKKAEQASKRNGVWNSSEMLSILGGCPSLNPSLPKTFGVSQQGTNSRAPTNPHTMPRKPLNPTNTHNMPQSLHFVITGIICYHLRRNRRTN